MLTSESPARVPRLLGSSFLHLSELPGAATHLAVVAVPLYAVVLVVRRLGARHPILDGAEPSLLGGAVAGMALAGSPGCSSAARRRPCCAARRGASAPCISGSASRSACCSSSRALP